MIEKKILLLSLSDENNWNFDKNIYNPLKSIFQEVVRYKYYRKRLREIGIKKLQNEIIDLAKRERPNYILWPSSMYEILEETFQELRKNGCIIFGWFSDDEVRFDDYSKWWIPYIDYFLTNSEKAVRKYSELSVKSIFCLPACNSEIYKKKEMHFAYEVSFVGRNISNRNRLIREIENNNINIHNFGFNDKAITFDEMIKIFLSSKINMNFAGSYANSEIKQIKARIFEVTMCGGFLFTEYVSGLEEYFEIDKEIVCFDTVEEAANKIRYYLKHDNERQAIAQAGWKRAHCHHTWEKRLYDLFKKIEEDITINGRPAISNFNLDLPEHVRHSRSQYHYRQAEELFIRKKIDLCLDELNISLKFNPDNKNSRRLLIISKRPNILKLIIFKITNAITRSRNKLRIRTRLRHFLRIQG